MEFGGDLGGASSIFGETLRAGLSRVERFRMRARKLSMIRHFRVIVRLRVQLRFSADYSMTSCHFGPEDKDSQVHRAIVGGSATAALPTASNNETALPG